MEMNHNSADRAKDIGQVIILEAEALDAGDMLEIIDAVAFHNVERLLEMAKDYNVDVSIAQ